MRLHEMGRHTGTVLASFAHSGRALAAQVLTTFFGLSHGLNKQKTEHRQTNARHQTHEYSLQPTHKPIISACVYKM